MRNRLCLVFLSFFLTGYSQTGFVEIDSLLSKSTSFYKTNQDSALFYSDVAYKKAIMLNDTSLIGKTITHKTTYLISKKKYNEALILLNFNLTHKQLLTKKDLGLTYANLAAVNSLKEQRDTALINYFNAIDIFAELNDFNHLARNYLNVGVIYENEGHIEQADYFYDNSLRYSKLGKNKAVTSLHDDVKRDSKTNFETKLKISLKALKSIDKPNESRLAAVIYHDLSKNYIDNRYYEKAIETAKKAITIKENIGYLQNLDFDYFILGKSQIRLNQDEGIKNLKQAISLSEKRTLKPLMFEMLVLGYKNAGDFESAYKMSEEFIKLKDSIALLHENERIAEITSKFETEKQAKEILQLKQENQEKKLQLSHQENMWWRLAAFALLLAIAIFYLAKSYVDSKKKIKEIEYEKEIITKKVETSFIILNNKTKIYVKDLKYVKSDANYLEFYTQHQKILDRNKLKTILEILPPNFVRCHKSYIVNKNFISSIGGSSLIVVQNIEIPISRTYKENI